MKNNKLIKYLQENYPSVVNETEDGNLEVNFNKLKEELNDVNISEETYGLNWMGKSYARVLRDYPVTTLIEPDNKHNNLEENKDSNNVYIEGDNLEVLKHLKNAYSNKIKMIYIDPPYNTGSDGFVYNDSFNFKVEDFMQLANVDEDEAKKILDYTTSKRSSHSAWLTFMYPRLYIARELLKEDGVIFISIDENEQAQLKLLCDEVFGEDNFISKQFVLDNVKGKANDNFVSDCGSYCYIYSKNKELSSEKGGFNMVENNLSEKIEQKYNFEDEVGRYKLTTIKKTGQDKKPEDRPKMFYPILEKSGILYSIKKEEYDKIYDKNNQQINYDWVDKLSFDYSKKGYNVIIPKDKNGNKLRWTIGFDKYDKEKNENIIYNNNNVMEIQRIKPIEELLIYATGNLKTIMYKTEYSKGTDDAKKLLEADLFDFPKPVFLIKDFIL